MSWIAAIVENAGEWYAMERADDAASTATDRAKSAADVAYERSKFKPYDVSGAFGQGIIDADTGQASFEMTPEMQQIQDLYQQQALTYAGQDQTAIGQQAGALGQDFLGQINADPYAAAESQFSRMEDILNPARQRQREALESRLLRQGRLGSTGGSLQQQGLETGIEESRRRGLFDALSQSQQMQQNQSNMGTKLGLFGQQQEDVGFQKAQGRLGGIANVDAQALDYLRLGSALGGRQAQAGAAGARFGMEGAAAGQAALLGAAAGEGAAAQKAAGAFGDWWRSDNASENEKGGSNYYSGSSYGDTESEADTSGWGSWMGV